MRKKKPQVIKITKDPLVAVVSHNKMLKQAKIHQSENFAKNKITSYLDDEE